MNKTFYSNYDNWKLAYPDFYDNDIKCTDLSEMSKEEIIEAIDYGDFKENTKEKAISYLLEEYNFNYYKPDSHI